MESRAKISNITRDFSSGKVQITFTVDHYEAEEVDRLMDKDLRLKAVIWREKRSLDANGLLWHCIGEIAKELRTDKWDIYLTMLRRYGVYTYIVVKPNMVSKTKETWRECEELGEIDINGEKGIQLLCYFGSHTYDSKEFSILLDGVISEMKEMGLETPMDSEMRRVIEQWEKRG